MGGYRSVPPWLSACQGPRESDDEQETLQFTLLSRGSFHCDVDTLRNRFKAKSTVAKHALNGLRDDGERIFERHVTTTKLAKNRI